MMIPDAYKDLVDLAGSLRDKVKKSIKVNNKSIFTERNFKWFDPATGIGNFSVAIYLKLIEGLKFNAYIF